MRKHELIVRPRLSDVKRLLDDASLPSSDVDEESLEYFVAVRLHDTLSGIIGLEPYGREGLLRSLVVQPSVRGNGIGRVLVKEAEQRAGLIGIETLYLLTTSAESYFRRLGYRGCAREAAPPPVRQSQEFSTLCPADAAFLCRHLNPAVVQ